jgi:hypothetical protein
MELEHDILRINTRGHNKEVREDGMSKELFFDFT